MEAGIHGIQMVLLMQIQLCRMKAKFFLIEKSRDLVFFLYILSPRVLLSVRKPLFVHDTTERNEKQTDTNTVDEIATEKAYVVY